MLLAEYRGGRTVDHVIDMTLNPTRRDDSARIRRHLDDTHCHMCRGWATGRQPWWTRPDGTVGRAQTAEILEHLATYTADLTVFAEAPETDNARW